MLIRKPQAVVYEAFIDPAMTTKFWFSRSSGGLEVGKTIRWDWEMYGVHTLVQVKQLEPPRRILVDWNIEQDPTTVEWVFSARSPGATFVRITNSGFTGDGDKIVAQALDSATGFQLVLAGLKAFLEFGIDLNLIADRHPDLIQSRPLIPNAND